MKHKKIILGLFVLVALTQLFLPYNSIRKQAADVLTGTEFKFRIRHNKPGTYERVYTGASLEGKFIWMQFEENRFRAGDYRDWKFNQVVHVTFTKDSMGFAKVQSVSKTRPATGPDFIKARAFRNDRDSSLFILQYPFNNYYIEDKDTRDIREALTKKMNDTLTTNYLVIAIKENKFIAKDLVIDNQSFTEFVKNVRANKNN